MRARPPFFFVKIKKIVDKNSKKSTKIMTEYGIRDANGRFSTKDEFSPFRYCIRKIKQRLKSAISRNRGLDFSLSLKDLKLQWDKQDGVCPYTNKKMTLVRERGNSSPFQMSLDRIDSLRGYVKGNIEFVCLSVNYAKNSFSRDQMMFFFGKAE